jgi:predicted nucleic acid-binding protein
LILADTSIWIEHFRSANAEMREHLSRGHILIHPLIIAELALGSLKERTRTLALFDRLPLARMAQIDEVRNMIEVRGLYNRGIGLVDAHLIASVFLTPSTLLWTKDKPLRKLAAALRIHVGVA